MAGQVILLCVIVALPGALVAFTAWKYHGISKARNYIVAVPVMCGVIVAMFAMSNVFEAGCFGDPSRTCTYNDMIPMIAIAVFVFVVMSLIKAWLLFADR